MRIRLRSRAALAILLFTGSSACAQGDAYVRVNLVGYRADGAKIAIGLGTLELPAEFQVVDVGTQQVVFDGRSKPIAEAWGQFTHHAELDFSGSTKPASTNCVWDPQSRRRSESRPKFTPSCPINCWSSCASSGAATTRGSMKYATRTMAARVWSAAGGKLRRCPRRLARCGRPVEISAHRQQCDGADAAGVPVGERRLAARTS